MQITGCAVSLTVDDVAASSAFFIKHLGFHEAMAADGFASLKRDDAGMNVVLLRRGIEVLPPGFRDQRAAGVIVAFVVTDLAGEERRLQAEGVAITMPLREEPWGERLFQITDPNGVVVELVEWSSPPQA
ncbi:VOC family protein [Nannocystis radixulma]|uniref:VOC family protein n=1 Tax=Nannocystis radixulma TaxID=2995305 RepID=A0ABT5BQ26_9BACT|nr:VOC family protein [Nannocystis radixulma]MDC0675828.1 VOC family protein [Nannocystis radixulma]